MSEKKAYDVKILLEKLKEQGLEIAEESAKILINGTFDWLEESAVLSENPYDDMAKVVYPKVRDFAIESADKINPADNE